MERIDTKLYAASIHANAVSKGFWSKATSLEHYLSLVVSEAVEAMECYRSGQSVSDVDPSIIAVLKLFVEGKGPLNTVTYHLLFKEYMKETYQVEMADVAIRLLDIMGYEQGAFDRDFGVISPNIDISEEYFNKSFTEQLWVFTSVVTLTKNPTLIFQNLLSWFDVTPHCSNLEFYIKAKILYNSNRPYLHNKKF